jgi:SAM-dependent methyltransferase
MRQRHVIMRMNRLRQSAAAHKLKKMLFLLGSRGPESRWYGGYRLGELVQSLKKPFSENQLPAGYGRWIDERIVEYPWLFSRLPDGPGKLLDAGSVLNHHFIVSHPKLQAKDVTIITLAPEEECHWRNRISYVYGDIRNMVFRDDVFDYVLCISTLEHIGLDNRRFHGGTVAQSGGGPESHLLAMRELRRVLKPGGRCFVSVPYGRRAVQDWQQIFDAEIVERLIQAFAPASCGAIYFRYSDENGWKLCDKAAAADARYFNFQTDTPWKGHPAAAEAVVCLELQK